MLWTAFSTRAVTNETPESNELEAARELLTSGFDIVETDHLVEEEELPNYHPDRFYPVRLGDVLHERYQILVKLGFGSCSTIWLARDLKSEFSLSTLGQHLGIELT